jgi:glycosyltransferase involved in cell wall biosynthesis
MRILYLIPRFPLPSETFISEEVLGLQKLGLDIIPVAFGQPNARDVTKMGSDAYTLMTKVTYLDNGDLYRVNPSFLFRSLLRTWSLNLKLGESEKHKTSGFMRLIRAVAVAKVGKQLRCTHVHTHWSPASKVGSLVQKILQVPFSMSVHAHEATHDSGHFPVVFPMLSFSTFCNKAVMNKVIERVPQAEIKSHLVYHGVDLEAFRPTSVPEVCGPLRVVSVGRLTPDKRFDRLVRALHLAKSKGLNAELTIVGNGETEGQVMNLSYELGVADKIKITGWVPHQNVARYLAEAHILTLLSEDYGLPNVILEAQAVGRPIVISPMAACNEGIKHGLTGWIVSHPEAYEEVVARWNEVYRRPELLQGMSDLARQFVEQNYDRRKSLLKLAKLFESCRSTSPMMSEN